MIINIDPEKLNEYLKAKDSIADARAQFFAAKTNLNQLEARIDTFERSGILFDATTKSVQIVTDEVPISPDELDHLEGLAGRVVMLTQDEELLR